MPELPDVEAFRSYINATSLYKAISNVAVENERALADVSSRSLQMRLKGRELRHSKYLFVATDATDWPVLHFGMAGWVMSTRMNSSSRQTFIQNHQ